MRWLVFFRVRGCFDSGTVGRRQTGTILLSLFGGKWEV